MLASAFSRRGFLASSAAALAFPPLPPAASTANDEGSFRLGVASYSFRKFSREAAIDMLRDLNVDFVNIKDFHLRMDSTPGQIVAARREFENAGIAIEGGGNISFTKDDSDDIRHKFEYAKLAGMPLIVCAPTHETLPKLEKYVKEYDIKLALHNHGPEDKHFPTPASVLDAVKNMDPRCGLCMDIGHTARTGVDVVESVRKAGARLLDMHCKDLKSTTEKASQVPVGDGVLPIVGIFKELK